ncbi:MAG: D-alanyl-D-alanine carboxypeptidase [Bdellovibrio sp.]|nr:MAG: D-alanyl-D-alanine carboxypeptidase [Bdellovibrio sp.]
MRGSLLEQRLRMRIEEALPGAAPGLQLQAHLAGRKVCDISVGDTYPYYDLASLTKIIFTVPAMMWAFEKGWWTPESVMSAYWPEFPKPQTRLTQFLTHSSGAPAVYPFFQELNLQSSVESRRQVVKAKIQEIPFEPKDESVYSDVGFLVLGYALEKMFDKPLFEIWQALREQAYPGLSTLDFHPANRILEPQRFYAPTERCAWRGRLVQGEVHDENAWALGGVSTHSGLFGSIDDLAWYGLFLRSQLLGFSKTFIKAKTAKFFTQRARPLGKGDWALGFMMPTPGGASCGDYFSPYSVGHTGFTGTSLWYDPVSDLLVAILSNRVLLGRDLKTFPQLRPKIHNWTVEELRRV